MRRGFKCKREIIEKLRENYERIIEVRYNEEYLTGLKDFDRLAEGELRGVLDPFYSNIKSRNQAWKACKGELYEYCLLYTSPSPRDLSTSRMPSSA